MARKAAKAQREPEMDGFVSLGVFAPWREAVLILAFPAA